MRDKRSSGIQFAALVLCSMLSACGGGDSRSEGIKYASSIDEPTYVLTDASDVDEHDRLMIADYARNEEPNGPRFYQMIQDLGGFIAYDELVRSQDRAHIESVLSKYGIGYETQAPGRRVTIQSTEATSDTPPLPDASTSSADHADPMQVKDCIQVYPAQDRGKTFALGSHTVFIDANGRPGFSTWKGDPKTVIVAGKRDESCQSKVGSWGLPGDQGGHLVPNGLGGWGGRANMVPQAGPLNIGAWRKVETVPAVCATTKATTYMVTPQYSSASGIRPGRLEAKIVLPGKGSGSVTAAVVNTPNTAPSAETQQLIEAFRTKALNACGA